MAKTKTKEVGFDLTAFKSVKAFKEVLKANKLHYASRAPDSKAFRWKGKGVEMRTGNNPVTGTYIRPKQRSKEPGYASYIGIKGEPKKVAKLAKAILKKTSYVKEYDPKMNSFIW